VISALAHVPASFGAVALLVQPVGTAVIGWIVLSEVITIDKALGIAIILLGIWVARKGTPAPQV
jgi:drug/metabolite transporter (DMT)-like permease